MVERWQNGMVNFDNHNQDAVLVVLPLPPGSLKIQPELKQIKLKVRAVYVRDGYLYCFYWCSMWVHLSNTCQEAPPRVQRSLGTCVFLLDMQFGALLTSLSVVKANADELSADMDDAGAFYVDIDVNVDVNVDVDVNVQWYSHSKMRICVNAIACLTCAELILRRAFVL